MTNEHVADRALRTLRALAVPEAEPGAAAQHRRRLVERLEQLSREGQARRLGRRWLALSVAAGVLCVVGAGAVAYFGHETAGADHEAVAGAATPESGSGRGQALQFRGGSELKTDPDSLIELRTELGVRMAVRGASELRLAKAPESKVLERVLLERGTIEVKVPKLGLSQQFQVRTPDALVIVHGTEFSVAVLTGTDGKTRTRVQVTSGRVEVRREAAVEFLGAGAHWSSELGPGQAELGRTSPETAPEMALHAGSETLRTERQPAAGGAGRAAGSLVNEAASPLAQSNALLERALAEIRQGNDARALVLLDELLRRFPDSPVAGNAEVERFRALKRLGRTEAAARAADGYSRRQPDGLARDEARALGK